MPFSLSLERDQGFALFSLNRLSGVPSFFTCRATALFTLYRLSGVPSAFNGAPGLVAAVAFAPEETVFVFAWSAFVRVLAVLAFVSAVFLALSCAMPVKPNPVNKMAMNNNFFILSFFEMVGCKTNGYQRSSCWHNINLTLVKFMLEIGSGLPAVPVFQIIC